ncbi:SseB family protein [Lysobacter sp. SG-8]|uniref:SseB family protein n=1 Tax=Marilutibacter penaei TaxID=2759900 RepID=A0A7W3YFK8_9GAMM|nr:SseB family protein [Lysobacter penaei]MBB1089312.1 SseB family protein [Lysobacter penaei]
MESQPQFVPANDLEALLLQAQLGRVPASEFLDALLSSQVVVLLDKDPGPSGVWDNSASPLVLSNSSGSPVLAMFTAAERSTPWHKQLPRFEFGLLVQFQWLLRGIASNVGIVINPGHPVGLELAPEAVVDLRARLQAASVAT